MHPFVLIRCTRSACRATRVLVTSAPGRIGKELVALLAKSGKFTVRAAAFTPEKADMLRSLGTPLAMPYATEAAP